MKPSTVVLYEKLQVNLTSLKFFGFSLNAWSKHCQSGSNDQHNFRNDVARVAFRLLHKLLDQAMRRLQQQHLEVLVVLEPNLGLQAQALSELMSRSPLNLVPRDLQMILHP